MSKKITKKERKAIRNEELLEKPNTSNDRFGFVENIEAKNMFLKWMKENPREQPKPLNRNPKDLITELDAFESGFDKIFDDKYYSVYSPIMGRDENHKKWINMCEDDSTVYDAHLGLYKKILGGVESQCFNVYAYVDESYYEKRKIEVGEAPYDPLNSWYRMAFLLEKNTNTFTPLYFNTHDMSEKQRFMTYHGEEVYLSGLMAAVFRTTVACISLSGFNSNQNNFVNDLLGNSMSKNDFCKNNWMSTYDNSYCFGSHLSELVDWDEGMGWVKLIA